MLGHDPENIAGSKVDTQILKRAWVFARPYRIMIIGFLATIVLDAILVIAPPLLLRSMLDNAIPSGDRRQVWILAGLTVLAALGDAILSVAQRWWSARIGEGLIYELRSALFDRVQRQPIAFFTRTQTGALISRMNNDVIGAQSAVTGTLGTVVSNVITLALTLVAMIALEWRLTFIALLVLPIFVIPAKRVGRKLQVITREQMNLNSSMNTTMTERFNVSGAMLVKLYGDPDAEAESFSNRASRVRDMGIKSAMYGRVFFVALGLVAAIGTAVIYGLGAQMVISGTITIGTLVALAAYVGRVYGPLTSLTNARVDVMTALVSFERVFEVLDAPNPLEDSPGAFDLVDPVGRVEFDDVTFRYPAGASVSVAIARGRGRPGRRQCAGARRRCRRRGAPPRVGRHRAGPPRRTGRAERRGQDDARLPRPAPLRRDQRSGARRRARRAPADAALVARRDRSRRAGSASLPRISGRQPAVREAVAPPRPSSRPRAVPRRSTT